MTAKLKIDLSLGILEVEGSETFVKTIYNDFKAQFIQGESAAAEPQPPTPRRRRTRTQKTASKSEAAAVAPVTESAPAARSEATPPTPEESRVSPATPAPVPSYVRIKDLNLSATPNHPSLVEFMDSKLPITNEERNLVFLYYLQHVINLETVTIDHVYTCYREVNIRAPLNLEYSLRTTAKQKGWITLTEDGQMTVTPEGKAYLETQLPKKVKG